MRSVGRIRRAGFCPADSRNPRAPPPVLYSNPPVQPLCSRPARPPGERARQHFKMHLCGCSVSETTTSAVITSSGQHHFGRSGRAGLCRLHRRRAQLLRGCLGHAPAAAGRGAGGGGAGDGGRGGAGGSWDLCPSSREVPSPQSSQTPVLPCNGRTNNMMNSPVPHPETVQNFAANLTGTRLRQVAACNAPVEDDPDGAGQAVPQYSAALEAAVRAAAPMLAPSSTAISCLALSCVVRKAILDCLRLPFTATCLPLRTTTSRGPVTSKGPACSQTSVGQALRKHYIGLAPTALDAVLGITAALSSSGAFSIAGHLNHPGSDSHWGHL